MARKAKKKIENIDGVTMGGGGNFFVSIGDLTGRESAASERKPAAASLPEKETPERGADARAIERVILRRETRGRGGRTVTVAETRPPLSPEAAEELAKSMRKGMGCGSHVEDGGIILQGDVRDRAEEWLTKRGIKKITRAN